jgi:hypothetical protein
MSTFKSSTLVESGRRGRKGSIDDDGESQEHILEEEARSVYSGPGIRKNTSVTVSGYQDGPLRDGARQFG